MVRHYGGTQSGHSDDKHSDEELRRGWTGGIAEAEVRQRFLLSAGDSERTAVDRALHRVSEAQLFRHRPSQFPSAC